MECETPSEDHWELIWVSEARREVPSVMAKCSGCNDFAFATTHALTTLMQRADLDRNAVVNGEAKVCSKPRRSCFRSEHTFVIDQPGISTVATRPWSRPTEESAYGETIVAHSQSQWMVSC